MAYYVSAVPGQNLMRDQDVEQSWKLGNTAGNGGVMSGENIVFRPLLPSHINLWTNNLA